MKIETEKITALRHELHMYPELSLCETQTKQRLMNFIKRETDLAVTDCGKWFYAFYPSQKRNAQTIAFRADFDALAIPEENDLPYCSQNSGISHRCGHDGHSAVLCGFAMAVSRYGADKNIYFIFQHAEEIGAGGRECAPLIREKNISEIYAFHNWSGFPKNSIVIREGIVQCASKGLTISFMGTSAHASQPEDGRNPSEAIAKLVLSIGEIAREKDYQGMVLATIVNISAGAKNFGIAASEGEVSVTLRSFYEADCEKLENRILEKAKELAGDYDLLLSREESDVFPETVNEQAAIKRVISAAKACGKQIVYLKEPFRSSEDFGYYQKECPGAIFYIGNGENYPQIHTTEYDFNDTIIKTAIEMFAALSGINQLQ